MLDDNSFVEVGAYVTARSTDFNMQAQETPGDGVITGYGTIEGALVYVYSQEASVMGGSMGEMHAAKIEKLYHMAMKTGAPVIGLLDCAGLRLQEGIDAFERFSTPLFMSDHGVRRDPADPGGFRNLRRRNGGGFRKWRTLHLWRRRRTCL